ncbi:hypothetical protein [Aquimarina sp. I32.4]|uniref:hypothetical protein n=1 Tax=Aquimarina sp. I32.4 TaxID=2053903 RepID=UPI0011AF15E7|nr:hypothetical protein [Aquimarina sp. I32.4]
MRKLDFGTSIMNDTDTKPVSFHIELEKLRHTYGVLLVFLDENNKKLQIHYEIEIICTEQIDEQTYILELYKKQVYINEKVPDSLSDELAERCGKVIYPLQLKVSSMGGIIAIANHDQIQQRWHIEREKIKQYYQGADTHKLIMSMDSMIESEQKLKNTYITQDWFMILFFSYMTTHLQQKNILLPWIPYKKGVLYQIEQSIQSHPHKQEDTIVKHKATLIDGRNEDAIFSGIPISIGNNKPAVTGEIDMSYQTYKDSSIVNAITGNSTIVFPSGKSKKLTIEIYHLGEKTPQTSEERLVKEKELKEQEPKPTPKKKRYFIFGKEIKFGK